jgi:ATP synthase protein I
MGESNDEKRGLTGLRYVGVGFSFAAYTAVGWYGGRWCDGRFGTEPWCATVGTLLGVGLAVWDLLRLSAALDRADKERDQ